MNISVFTGRIVTDLVVKEVTVKDQLVKVLNFWVACDDRVGKNKNTEFIKCTAWRGAAETIAQYGFKGREFNVAGAVHTTTFIAKNNEGKDEVVTRLAIPRIVAFEFAGAGKDNVSVTEEEAAAAAAASVGDPCPWTNDGQQQ